MASVLVLILSDFFPRGEPAERESVMMPRLQGLEVLLSRARREALPEGWRRRLALQFGTPQVAGLAPAAAAANAWLPASASAASQYWFATPVHYFAGLDSVHLHPAGLLQLPLELQTQLVADFAGVFGDAPWRLHAIGRRELLLSGPALAASAEDPAQFLGRDPGAGLPRGPPAATLRRLGAEIEMWLHEHPINRQRRASGELTVSALWLWGAMAPEARAPTRSRPGAMADSRLFGEDAYAEALWRLSAGRCEPATEQFDRALHGAHGAAVVLYSTVGDDGLDGALQRLEQRWLVPALRALRTRRLAAIELLAGKERYVLRWLHLARVWRSRPPWWERLA